MYSLIHVCHLAPLAYIGWFPFLCPRFEQCSTYPSIADPCDPLVQPGKVRALPTSFGLSPSPSLGNRARSSRCP